MTGLPDAEAIIEAFGGIRPMAKKLGVAVTTVQGWKKRGAIPESRIADIHKAAAANDIDLAGIAGSSNPPPPRETVPAHEKRVVPTSSETDRRRRSMPRRANEKKEFMDEIRHAEGEAVDRSVLAAGALVALVCGIAVFLFWPVKQQVAQNAQQISALQADVKVTEQSVLANILPADMKKQITDLRQQAQTVQTTVKQVGQQVDALTREVVGPDGGTVSQRIARLEEQMVALGAPADMTALVHKLETLSADMEGQTQLSGSFAELQTLVAGLQGRMDHLDAALSEAQKIPGSALSETFSGVSGTDLQAAAMLLTLSQLRTSLNRSAPFAEDLALMQQLLGEDNPDLNAAIVALAPKAAEGVLTPQGLSDEFKGLAGDIVVASLKGEDVSVREKAQARLNSVLQVEKDGALLTGTETQAMVARAQTLLDAGDIEGAMAALQTLQGPAATAAQPFMDEAAMTLLAQELQRYLTSTVMTRMGKPIPYTAAPSLSVEALPEAVRHLLPERSVISDETGTVNILTPKKGAL
ncbi:MAG: uroporphyrinogen III synthase HEM4 [Alphaproteobacteria bacterium]|nr:uroporphyrinogen III synthase HEM4 [Alphaproteobacteria bacterium]